MIAQRDFLTLFISFPMRSNERRLSHWCEANTPTDAMLGAGANRTDELRNRVALQLWHLLAAGRPRQL